MTASKKRTYWAIKRRIDGAWWVCPHPDPYYRYSLDELHRFEFDSPCRPGPGEVLVKVTVRPSSKIKSTVPLMEYLELARDGLVLVRQNAELRQLVDQLMTAGLQECDRLRSRVEVMEAALNREIAWNV